MSQTFKQFLIEGRSPLVVALDNYSKFISNIDGSKEGKLIVSVPKGSGNADDFREAIKSNKMISRQLNNIDSTREPAKFIFDVNQVNEGAATAETTIDIAIGYDDHISVYRVPASLLASLYRIDDADDINDEIIDNGEHISNSEEEGEVFFDLTHGDIAEFRSQLKDVVE